MTTQPISKDELVELLTVETSPDGQAFVAYRPVSLASPVWVRLQEKIAALGCLPVEDKELLKRAFDDASCSARLTLEHSAERLQRLFQLIRAKYDLDEPAVLPRNTIQ